VSAIPVNINKRPGTLHGLGTSDKINHANIIANTGSNNKIRVVEIGFLPFYETA